MTALEVMQEALQKIASDESNHVTCAIARDALTKAATAPDDRHEALWFTPVAIREHFEGDDSEVGEWVAEASDDDLHQVGQECLCADPLYEAFHSVLECAVQERIDAVTECDRCPECGSDETYTTTQSSYASGDCSASRCEDCGHEWGQE